MYSKKLLKKKKNGETWSGLSLTVDKCGEQKGGEKMLLQCWYLKHSMNTAVESEPADTSSSLRLFLCINAYSWTICLNIHCPCSPMAVLRPYSKTEFTIMSNAYICATIVPVTFPVYSLQFIIWLKHLLMYNVLIPSPSQSPLRPILQHTHTFLFSFYNMYNGIHLHRAYGCCICWGGYLYSTVWCFFLHTHSILHIKIYHTVHLIRLFYVNYLP